MRLGPLAALLLPAVPLGAPVPAVAPAQVEALGSHDFIVAPDPRPQYWAISPADAKAAKDVLQLYLGRAHPVPSGDYRVRWSEDNRPEIATHFREYDLQYRGVRMRGDQPDPKGKRKIEIQGLCRAGAEDRAYLAKEWLVAYDGGSCYFKALYDPATRRITWFDVNGIA